MTSAEPLLPLKTLRCGCKVLSSGRAMVLHSSSRAVNLEFDDRVVTILNRKGMMSPSSVILDVETIPDTRIGEFVGDALITDSFSTQLDQKIDLSISGSLEGDLEALQSNLREAIQPKEYSIAKALIALEGGVPQLKGMERAIVERQMDVFKMARCPEELASGLLGLGFGLTPSGDDFVMGMISFMNLRGMETSRIRAVVDSYPNPFSKTILINALDGQYPEPLFDFLQSVISNEKLGQGIENLCAMGHSSGSDTLTGFYFALSSMEVEKRTQRKQC